MTGPLRAYAAVTAAYWAFMLTDGALRMLVLLHFHALGFTPLQLAWLFLLYEVAGIVTNLTAGWLGQRFGLALTLKLGLAVQIAALAALTFVDASWTLPASVAYVMAVQGASGVAKDLAKTASKSAVKLLAPEGRGLFRWVAALTGSKNAVKGLGFFLGAGLLAAMGFAPALWAMAACLAGVLAATVLFLPDGLSMRDKGAKFSRMLSPDPRVNWLSAGRVMLFGARDVWFVVALPIWLTDYLTGGAASQDGAFYATGAFMALWIVGYGLVQALTPRIMGEGSARAAALWAAGLATIPSGLAAWLWAGGGAAGPVLVGLMAFGAVFAVNSALHSYLILHFADGARVTRDVGFYYMANAAGRLLGTALSGLCYQAGGLGLSLAASAGMLLLSSAALTPILRARQPA